jgi:hypothetical protein
VIVMLTTKRHVCIQTASERSIDAVYNELQDAMVSLAMIDYPYPTYVSFLILFKSRFRLSVCEVDQKGADSFSPSFNCPGVSCNQFLPVL